MGISKLGLKEAGVKFLPKDMRQVPPRPKDPESTQIPISSKSTLIYFSDTLLLLYESTHKQPSVFYIKA